MKKICKCKRVTLLLVVMLGLAVGWNNRELHILILFIGIKIDFNKKAWLL